MNTVAKLKSKTTVTWWWQRDFLSPKKFPLMSRNARNNENGTLDEISSKRVNFHGFDDFDQF